MHFPRVAERIAPSIQRLPAIKKRVLLPPIETENFSCYELIATINDIEKETRKILLSCPRFG